MYTNYDELPVLDIEIENLENIEQLLNSIAEHREKINLSKKDLAEKCGISVSSIERMESYKSVPNAITLLRILSIVGLEMYIENTY